MGRKEQSWGISQFGLGHGKLKIPMSHPRGNIKSSDCYLHLELGGEEGLEAESCETEAYRQRGEV